MAGSTKRYVAVDLGISDGKVVLASVSGGTLSVETVHSFNIPPVNIAGNDYWDIYAAYSEVIKGLTMVGARKLAVESVGVNAWGPGIVCVAGDGSLLGLPRICGDFLSAPVYGKFFKRMEQRELFEATGVNVVDSHAALQLFAMRRSKSVALEDAKYLLFIPDAMAYLLSGKRFSGYTSLYAAGLVDRGTKKISKEVLSACKVRPKRFPSMVQPGAKPGKLTEEVAEVTGLGRIPVVAVAGRGLASAAAIVPSPGEVYSINGVQPSGSGVQSSSGRSAFSSPGIGSQPSQVYKEGSAFLWVGATGVLGVGTASPVVNDQTFEMNFSNEAGLDGVNLLVKRIPGMDLLDRCVAAWAAAGRAYGPEDVARMAREGAETSAQLDPEDPALRSLLSGPIADPADAIGRYCSLRSMTPPADDAAVIRLIYSSMAEKIGDTFTKLQSVTPFRIKSLYVIGEVAADPVLCQLAADECAVPVTAGPADAAILGNVLVQAGLSRQDVLRSFTPVTYTPSL